MYCGSNRGRGCSMQDNPVRVGTSITNEYGLERLFYRYGVDVEMWGHQHSYERLLPLYNYEVKIDSAKYPYTNPKAPVHITSGAAGSREGLHLFLGKTPEWSVFHSEVSCTKFFVLIYQI